MVYDGPRVNGFITKTPESTVSFSKLVRKYGDVIDGLHAKGMSIFETEDFANIGDPYMNGNFSNADLKRLVPLSKLKMLSLRYHRITDRGLKTLSKFQHLESVNLESGSIYTWSRKLTDAAFQYLSHVPSLTEISIHHARITGIGIKYLSNKNNILKLELRDCPLNEDGFKEIANLSNLKKLEIGSKEISDKAIAQLVACQELEEFDLFFDNSPNVTDGCVKFLKQLPNLKVLVFGIHHKISDAAVDDLLAFPKLEKVRFWDNQISLAGLERLKNRGISVSHGTLKDFRRTTNFLCYSETYFAVDIEDSYIQALICLDTNQVHWNFEINCLDELIPDGLQIPKAQSPFVMFSRSWRELENLEFKLENDVKSEINTISINESHFYLGWHECPDRHTIRFGSRRGRFFQVKWNSTIKDPQGDIELVLDAAIPFSKVRIRTQMTLNTDEALAILKKNGFDPHEFVLDKNSEFGVCFNVKDAVD